MLGLTLAFAVGGGVAAAQMTAEASPVLEAANVAPLVASYSSSAAPAFEAPPAAAAVTRGGGAIPSRPVRPFSQVGISARVGTGGIGFDTATPLARHFNLRTGADFFGYASTFQEQGANVAINLQLRTAHANLDWFPFHNGFHVSPMVVYGNNNEVQATVLVPSGTTITLSGTNYISSLTDPLHGNGSVGFRKVAPGLTLGWGNIVPRSQKHWSFPVELGFYYVGQPTLKVAFTGSACDPTMPAAIGCESVMTDASFQQSLQQFTARNNNNLSYASFFPVLTTGVGYRF